MKATRRIAKAVVMVKITEKIVIVVLIWVLDATVKDTSEQGLVRDSPNLVLTTIVTDAINAVKLFVC